MGKLFVCIITLWTFNGINGKHYIIETKGQDLKDRYSSSDSDYAMDNAAFYQMFKNLMQGRSGKKVPPDVKPSSNDEPSQNLIQKPDVRDCHENNRKHGEIYCGQDEKQCICSFKKTICLKSTLCYNIKDARLKPNRKKPDNDGSTGQYGLKQPTISDDDPEPPLTEETPATTERVTTLADSLPADNTEVSEEFDEEDGFAAFSNLNLG